ncbi:hypothetical protein BC826DRAFT_653285 [Russula brevipes]|nr:hypothetical protein BC826DRAFT_653285 [Russula brevipes]
MRDKEAVQAYKMNIKAHLLRLGLIRGQPRTSLTAASSAQARSLVGTPSTGTNSSRAGSERGSFPFTFDDPQKQLEISFPSGMISMSGKEGFTYLKNRIHMILPRQCSRLPTFSCIPILLGHVDTERPLRLVPYLVSISLAGSRGDGGWHSTTDLAPG